MRRTAILGISTALCLGTLAGCGGGSDEPAGTTSSSTTSVSPAAPSSSTAADPGAGASTAAFTDAEACEWLTKNLPAWADITDPVSVQAQLTIGLSSFFEDHGGLANADGYAFDAATSRGCQAEHDKAVKQAGISSFGNL